VVKRTGTKKATVVVIMTIVIAKHKIPLMIEWAVKNAWSA
jgi:hypothetical protein